MYDITYVNEQGATVDFGTDKYDFKDITSTSKVKKSNGYRIIGFEGFSDTDADVQLQKSPFQDGTTRVDTLLDTKYPYLEFLIRASDYEELSSLRSHFSRAFNPKLSGKLTLKIGSKTYELEIFPEHLPKFSIGSDDAVGTMQIGSISLVAPNPYWRSPNETAKPLVAYTGNFKLPMTFPFTLGTSGSKTTLYNEGDVNTPVRIEINGPTTNPQIFNRTTGESIRINRTVAEGEKMLINTEQGRQRIVVIDESGIEKNAFGFLDHNSTLFYLALGENEIEHVADAGNRHAQVVVKWDDLFVGV